MALSVGNSLAVKLTAFFIRFSGFWAEDTKFGRRVMDWIVSYSIIALIFAFCVTTNDLYHYFGDFDKFTYCSLNVCTVGFGLFKLILFATKRKMFLDLIDYAKINFWNVDYDDYGVNVMKQCMKRCVRMIIFAVLMCHLTVLIYFVKPVIANQGKNESERVLPFPIWLDLPINRSPWYEILYILEMFSAYHCGICYFCFDNFLCQINITLVGQFIILQKEIREIYDERSALLSEDDDSTRKRFVDCVKKHQKLILFTNNVKELYRDVILGVVVLLSFLICLELYQLMTAVGEALARLHYCLYAGGSVTQLYFFTLTCNDLTEASLAIADAAYDVRWFTMRSKIRKNEMVRDLSMVIIRSQRACSLTVGGFSPVTLQTFSSICHSAFSFLTLMRQSAAS